MRMLDVDKQTSVKGLQLYLTPDEALRFRDELNKLLKDPEANEHSHIYASDMHGEFSFSIITHKKMENISTYTALEQRILTEK